jgi:hypothetical protein
MQRLTPLLEGLPGLRQKDLEVWSDKDIRPGEPWHEEIQRALDTMDVFIAVVSLSFGRSNYIRLHELPKAKARLTAKEIYVLPIYLGPPSDGDCKWLMKLQRVPGEKSWAEMRADFPDYDHAQKLIRDAIKAVVERARQGKVGRDGKRP